LAWYSVIAITPSLAHSSFLKLASARARASSILVVNVLSDYEARWERLVRIKEAEDERRALISHLLTICGSSPSNDSGY
jgi:hypothetical protein